MRLLFLSNLFPPHDLGGLENRCHETATQLQQRGHTVYVLTSRYGARYCASHQEHVTRGLYLQADVDHYRPADFFLRRPWQERSNTRELRRVVEQTGPDVSVVWGMWNLSRSLPYWLEQWMPTRVAYVIGSYWPVDLDIHEGYWRSPAGNPMTELLKRLGRGVALWQLRRDGYPPALRFDHAVCNSQYVRDALVEATRLPASTGVLYPGIDPEPFACDFESAGRTSDQPLRLIYFGSLLPHKGVHTAIEALGMMRSRRLVDSVELTVLGSGRHEYTAHLQTLATELEVGDRVHFSGWVPRREVPFWLKKSDVFLFTSTWPEPFGRTIIEAMASGLVVIGSDVGGSREIFEHYSKELLYEPGDACGLADRIVRVLEDPSLRRRLAKAGRKLVVERFTLDRMVDDLERWMLEIASQPA